MDKKLLSVLACPICKGEVTYSAQKQEMICRADGIAFPVRDGIPVMLEQEGRTLTVDERLNKG